MKTTEFKRELAKLPTLKEKQLFYLNDVVNHYNINNRCTDGPMCKYTPTSIHTEGCAIGRRLPIDLNNELDIAVIGFDTSVASISVFKKLPKWMRNLGQLFLSMVQKLHDDTEICSYWDENGITEDGQLYVEVIKQEFDLV